MEGRLRVKAVLLCIAAAGAVWILGCQNKGQDPAGEAVWAEAGPDSSQIQEQAEAEGEDKSFGLTAQKREGQEKEIRLERDLRLLLEPEGLSVTAKTGSCRAVFGGDGSSQILVPEEFVRQVLEISVLEYPDSRILLQQGGGRITLKMGSREMAQGLDMQVLECGPFLYDGELYLPLEALCAGFGYTVKTEPGSRRVSLEQEEPFKSRGLPASYDYRVTGRSTKVRDQGSFGTCWSFASLTALETALRPKVSREFSADHMSLHNSFSLAQKDGGEYTMSMAYLLAWQGPVLEVQDPYGDGISPEGLQPCVHVQEIQILPSGDHRAIKRAVFLNGGVQSSLYTSITGSDSRSVYYNEETGAYCYEGDEIPNHDVVIVGWDDGYPKENFQREPEGDGAFLCVSSWGEAFGDKGYFYVSYYDSNIGGNGLVYTGIEPSDNYDNIYQSDLCGWVGQVGYGSETAFGANIYETEDEEILRAAGFYAAGEDTSYEISLARHVRGADSLENRNVVAKGSVKHSGFYTVPLKKPERLQAGERFALILKVSTPGAIHPIAVEYQADEATAEADVGDGESYISLDGSKWEPMEERYQCNLCLKGYTDRVSDGG